MSDSLQTGDAPIAAVAAETARFGEFGSSALDLAVVGTGGGEPGVNQRKMRHQSMYFVEPRDRLAGA